MTRRLPLLFGVLAMTLAAGPTAAQTPAVTAADLDRTALNALKDIHNKGADLYNTGDAAGCYRLYQGAVVAVRPFLAHRPKAQGMIDAGLAEVAKSSGIKIQAFRLHEVIEQVRAELKAEIKKAEEPKRKEPPTAAIPAPVPSPKTPAPVPAAGSPLAPTPKDPISPAATTAVVTGSVTLAGKPFDGEVTFVSLDQPAPRVFS
ncbi:MAG: hypothetical protein ACRC7O_19000, partial [Fimbriiglobus sp.]